MIEGTSLKRLPNLKTYDASFSLMLRFLTERERERERERGGEREGERGNEERK